MHYWPAHKSGPFFYLLLSEFSFLVCLKNEMVLREIKKIFFIF